eukprot:TRINITY_DN25351_c0_g2_i1.p1 TRINITY_DN25351_c0_g2~~TRINITY_DN25351_c0_g2_i1.p1  ORF type:complete len:267 (+),score=80.59 TRINITY_DN25351_c0_g2_i1:259-1059(+)
MATESKPAQKPRHSLGVELKEKEEEPGGQLASHELHAVDAAEQAAKLCAEAAALAEDAKTTEASSGEAVDAQAIAKEKDEAAMGEHVEGPAVQANVSPNTTPQSEQNLVSSACNPFTPWIQDQVNGAILQLVPRLVHIDESADQRIVQTAIGACYALLSSNGTLHPGALSQGYAQVASELNRLELILSDAATSTADPVTLSLSALLPHQEPAQMADCICRLSVAAASCVKMRGNSESRQGHFDEAIRCDEGDGVLRVLLKELQVLL